MRITIFEWMLLPFVLWGVFQGILYFNANQVEEAINIAIYEGSKKAAIQGYYSQDIYQEMRAFLEQSYHFDPAKVAIEGTESLRVRGEYLEVEVVVPKPRLHVIPLFNPTRDDFFYFKKFIMSEYTAGF